MRYVYSYGLSGIVEAPSEEHARLQLLMGISLSSRVAALGPEIAIQVAKVEEEEQAEEPADNGAKPKRRRKSAARPQLFEH